jgi:hypothetical protein
MDEKAEGACVAGQGAAVASEATPMQYMAAVLGVTDPVAGAAR